jgi:putative tryptophan/tyrosine transport system substrate-binding protein
LDGYYPLKPKVMEMKRRDFILSAVGAAVSLSEAQAQQTSMVVGVLGNGPQQAVRMNFARVKARLAEMGYVEGRNLTIEYHGADDQLDRLPSLVADLVQRPVAAIVAMSGPATSAAKGATTTIPIIFFTGYDPVESGFVNSLNRPGGNVTGVFILSTDLIFKRLELLHELVPAVKTIAFLHTQTAIKSADLAFESLRHSAETIGVKLLFFDVADANDLDESFAKAASDGAGALIVNSDAIFLNNRQKIIALAARHRLPAMYFIREYTAEGGLMSYGPDYTDAYREVGDIVGRVLKGEKSENLPVRQVTKIELVINAKTANSLGLTVPLALLGRADEIIE